MRGAGWILLATLSLSGCSGGGSDDPGGDDPSPEDMPTELQVPTWAVGDWWAFDSPFGPSTYVLTEDAGADWIFDTDNEVTAFFDAQTDISRLGPVRKSDLAGSQGSERVEFFRWPPVANDTWTTNWDGQDLDILVTEVTPASAVFEASNATGLVYRYTYDAEIEWFESIESYQPDGTLAFTFAHTDHGDNFTGEVYRWTLETLLDFTGNGPFQGGTEPFTVAGGVTDLWLEMHIVCPGNGGYVFAIAPAGQTAPTQHYEVNDQCSGAFDLEEAVVEAPAEGQWVNVRDVGGGPEPPTGTILLLARTLETIPVG